MNERLGASLNASHIVAHGVEAALGGVDLDDNLKLSLATGQLVLPVGAVLGADLDNVGLGVLSLLKHSNDIDTIFRVICLALEFNVWRKSWLHVHPAWREPSGNSSSHFVKVFSGFQLMIITL